MFDVGPSRVDGNERRDKLARKLVRLHFRYMLTNRNHCKRVRGNCVQVKLNDGKLSVKSDT